ncbi:hypothetical protein [Actinacidiphila yeochonensis]|uniref:hypothetical protein n=1 Tax=Actinacidiphila yeochonensis TaxID=89050 RepID=UPI000565687C|nr:hypothetical protein [Actinacidiphila yeochonensis]
MAVPAVPAAAPAVTPVVAPPVPACGDVVASGDGVADAAEDAEVPPVARAAHTEPAERSRS